MKNILLLLLVLGPGILKAQQPTIQYFRPNSKEGLHIFETKKTDTSSFDGIKVRVGGNFTQDFQGLRHQNTATAVMVNGVNTNELIRLTDGFNRAMANLNVDAQLADGIRLNLTLYLSSRHHEETWVKGGYLQIDKMLFFHSAVIDKIMEKVAIKIGDYELDYGDQHYRRSDGGNAIYNPFIENYIMDAFATEIGGELYYHFNSEIFIMAGVTNGELNPTIVKASKIDSATNKRNTYTPAIHGKIGFDKQVTPDLRLRFTGSLYAVKSTASNTLFYGDRTGSHYFYMMENTTATVGDNAFSGRYNPMFSQQVTTFMINPFVKFKGIEFLGTYEFAKGRTITEAHMRKANQFGVDLIYRFPQGQENFWLGGRYNSVDARQPGALNDISIERTTGSAGWFITDNIMLKAEYTHQRYKNFAETDIRAEGKFHGYMIQASIAF
jgi:hypothetical protein